MTETKPTRDDVEALKAAWVSDACFDLEDVEGYEAYRDELLAFRQEQEAAWAAQRQAALTEYAAEIGVPGDLTTAEHYRHCMTMREHWMEEARRYLLYYLGKVVTGDDLNQRECRAEIAMIVDHIVEAVEASVDGEIALEIAKLRAELRQHA